MFGGPCSHAGHAHHRRTRASLELLERQNTELGQPTLEENRRRGSRRRGQDRDQQQEAVVFMGSLKDTLTKTSSAAAAAATAVQEGGGDKRCSYCSSAIACLVVVALQESPGEDWRQEDFAILRDSGFDTASSYEPELLNSANFQGHGQTQDAGIAGDTHVSSELPQSTAGRTSHRDQNHTSSHSLQSKDTASVATSASSSSLANALGSEMASASSTNQPNSVSSKSSASSKVKGMLRQSSATPHPAGSANDIEDVELVDMTGDTSASIMQPLGSGSGSESGSGDQPVAETWRSRLEMDLAEALMTPAATSMVSRMSMPAVSLGIHPSLESVHEAVSGSRRESEMSGSDNGIDNENEGNGEEEVLLQLQTPPFEDPHLSPPLLPSPPPSVQPERSQDINQRERSDGEYDDETISSQRHSFYVLGIHQEQQQDSFLQEIEESMRKLSLADAAEVTTADVEGASNAVPEDSSAASFKENDQGAMGAMLPLVPEEPSVRPESFAEGIAGLGNGRDEEEPLEAGDQRPLSASSTSTFQSDDSMHSSVATSQHADDIDYLLSQKQIHNDHGSHSGDNDSDMDDNSTGNDSFDPLSTTSSSTSQLLDGDLSYASSDSGSIVDADSQQPNQDQDYGSSRLKSRKRSRRLLVDDSKRKQEQLEKIKAQLELRTLGKIREQVSFWEAKGVLEQKVVGVVDVEEEDDRDQDRN
ncbi:hypothetical protein BGZ98_000078 [Dissophora globulifera]|nr:hypothetical protein BGZ98_000078 [Dissophora globulifera]